ncbi:MAG: hypothetical protein GX430_01305 [Treponema sp.]|nr:hypothetical protein [Treponema sp.]
MTDSGRTDADHSRASVYPGRSSEHPGPGVRPRGPAALAAAAVAVAFLASAFLAAGIPVACRSWQDVFTGAASSGAASSGAAVPGAPAAPGAPGPYSVHAEGLRDPAAADCARMTAARVVRVVDGDTVVVEIPRPPVGLGPRETVRLIGVDAPELGRGNRPADPGGPQSAEAARSLLDSRRVLLAFDRELRDRYGRVLAYLYTPEGDCLNLALVRTGAARALLKYPFAFSAAFERAEREARAARLGLFSELYIP